MNILSKQFSSPPIIYPTSDDLVLWISGRNRTGNSKILDLSKKGNHGNIVGASWANTPLGHSALSFDGVDDYVEVPNDASLNITNAITIEAWICWRGGAGHRGIVVKNAGAGNQSYQLKKHDNPLVHGWFWVYTTDGIFVTGKFIPTTDRWYHLVGTYDGTKSRFYVDAMLDEEAMASGTILASDANLFIANWSILNRTFNGLIDEVRIYNRALSVFEISQRYNKTKYLYGM